MSTWIKWWKDKTFIKIWCVILITIGLSLGVILINPDHTLCILGSIGIACSGGFIIRKIITKRLNKLSNEIVNNKINTN